MARTVAAIIETGPKRAFASAVEWPGWCRSGRDERAALDALAVYASRYARVMRRTKLGFAAVDDVHRLRVVERVKGNATTEFGAPGVPAKLDAAKLSAAELARLGTILEAVWRALDESVDAARGRPLAKGPRGGGRSLDGIAEHVRDAEAAYLSGLGAPLKTKARGRELTIALRAAALDGIAASARGEIPAKGPRGGKRWTPRFFARRLAWHALDHVWEIEDRMS